MKKFRLKKEAVQFFMEKYATSIMTLNEWEKKGVDKIALDEVEPLRIEYGFPISKNGTSLNGWDENGSHFHFTLIFPSVKFNEHDKFTDGKLTRVLMNRIQSVLNEFYAEFVNNKDE